MAERRTAAKLIRFHREELARITERARASARTPGRFIREAALGAVPKPQQNTERDRVLRVTPEQMRAVVDCVLSDLGLSEHQAVMVAHQDRPHAHVHVMVNRVHPETGVAWERWQDRPRIERTLREAERALGLREVSGRLYQLDGREAPEPSSLSPGERRQ